MFIRYYFGYNFLSLWILSRQSKRLLREHNSTQMTVDSQSSGTSASGQVIPTKASTRHTLHTTIQLTINSFLSWSRTLLLFYPPCKHSLVCSKFRGEERNTTKSRSPRATACLSRPPSRSSSRSRDHLFWFLPHGLSKQDLERLLAVYITQTTKIMYLADVDCCFVFFCATEC